jgi:Legume lectin domain
MRIYSFLYLSFVLSDFVYPSFDDTSGLILNGNARTSTCPSLGSKQLELISVFDHSKVITQSMDLRFDASALNNTVISPMSFPYELVWYLNSSSNSCVLSRTSNSSFTLPSNLPVSDRLLLTNDSPNQIGSVFRSQEIKVEDGFETSFLFQITSASRQCNFVKDFNFGLVSYKTCSVNGGDGFSFLLQASGLSALGNGAHGLGYAGIRNGLAIEFDTFPNFDLADLASDHISVQGASQRSSGGVSTNGGYLTSDSLTRLSATHFVNISDAKIHAVKIVYLPSLSSDQSTLSKLTINQALTPFLVQDDFNRIGSLFLYFDDMSEPLFILPINLKLFQSIDTEKLFVGFTAATGNRWQKHEILSWYFCNVPNNASTCSVPADMRLFR